MSSVSHDFINHETPYLYRVKQGFYFGEIQKPVYGFFALIMAPRKLESPKLLSHQLNEELPRFFALEVVVVVNSESLIEYLNELDP